MDSGLKGSHLDAATAFSWARSATAPSLGATCAPSRVTSRWRRRTDALPSGYLLICEPTTCSWLAARADTVTDADFGVPTTTAKFGNDLYAVNARFGTPPTPDTEHDVVRVSKHYPIVGLGTKVRRFLEKLVFWSLNGQSSGRSSQTKVFSAT